jgi:hypothetical protein
VPAIFHSRTSFQNDHKHGLLLLAEGRVATLRPPFILQTMASERSLGRHCQMARKILKWLSASKDISWFGCLVEKGIHDPWPLPTLECSWFHPLGWACILILRVQMQCLLSIQRMILCWLCECAGWMQLRYLWKHSLPTALWFLQEATWIFSGSYYMTCCLPLL